MAHGLEHIHWAAPWLAPWRGLGQAVAARVEQGHSVSAALNLCALAPLTFVPQAELPPQRAYEDFLFEQRRCPTRDGLHDFFNGLCWMLFPHTKLQLNRLHAAEMAQAGVAATRGPVRDAATVLDENGALLHCPDALWLALQQRRWGELFGPLRPLWAQASLTLFGHALLEKLVAPRKGITAHVYRVQPAGATVAELDAWLAQDLSADSLRAKPFCPLPVLGVPGWWPANTQPDFYADTQVFRPSHPAGAA